MEAVRLVEETVPKTADGLAVWGFDSLSFRLRENIMVCSECGKPLQPNGKCRTYHLTETGYYIGVAPAPSPAQIEAECEKFREAKRSDGPREPYQPRVVPMPKGARWRL